MRSFRTCLRWFFRLAAAIGVVCMLVSLTPLVKWWETALAGPWDDPKGDILIVLTGSLQDDHTMGINSYWRAVYALRAFQEDHFQEMIISGGGSEATPIARPMKDFVVAMGVPASAVRVEIASRSTHDSAVQVAAMVTGDRARYQDRRLVLLTSDFHMFRAHRAFTRAGLTVAPRPIPDVRKRYGAILERWWAFLELTAESSKIAYYWARGWI